MFVGVVRIELYLHGVSSLKEKRSIVKRVVSRVRNQFDISAAEVDLQDFHQSAVIGCAVVTNDSRLADSIMRKVVDYVIDLHLADVGRFEVEVISV